MDVIRLQTGEPLRLSGISLILTPLVGPYFHLTSPTPSEGLPPKVPGDVFPSILLKKSVPPQVPQTGRFEYDTISRLWT